MGYGTCILNLLFQKWVVRCYPVAAAAYYHVKGWRNHYAQFFWGRPVVLPESCPYHINPCRTFLLHHAHTMSSFPFPCNMIFQYHTFDFHTITVPCIMHILCLIHLFHVSQGTRQAHTMPCTMIFLSPAPCLIDIAILYHTQNTEPWPPMPYKSVPHFTLHFNQQPCRWSI